MEITAGVHAFPQTIVRESGELTIYPAAVETQKGVLLIDVGDPGTTDQIRANLDGMGAGWDDVRGVVLTHHDGDHAGGLAEALELTNAVVYAHEECAPYVDGRKYPMKEDPDDRYPMVDVDVEMVEGVSFRTDAGPMEVVFTPGHTPGHVALYFPEERLLLVGDTITADDDDGLAPPWPENTPDVDRARESVRRLADLEVEEVLCYHGGLVEATAADVGAVADAMR